MFDYGWSLSLHRTGFMLVANGFMFSTFIGLNSGKRRFTFARNWWRKTKTKIPK